MNLLGWVAAPGGAAVSCCVSLPAGGLPERRACLLRTAAACLSAFTYPPPPELMTLLTFRTLARYNAWAHAKLFAALSALPRGAVTAPSGLFAVSIAGTLNHMALADLLWLERFTGHAYDPAAVKAATGVGVPPLSDLPALWGEASPGSAWECAVEGSVEALLRYTSSRWVEVVGSLDEASLEGSFSYFDTAGAPKSQLRCLALTHVFNHATHHRGQVTAVVTRLGAPAPALDLTYMLAEEAAAAAAAADK